MIVKFTAFAVSSSVEVLAMSEITGTSLIPLTVKSNVAEAVSVPSETVMSNVLTPDSPLAGEMVAVQLGAVPDQTTFASGMRVVFEEVRLILVEVQATALSTSEIVKLTAFAVSSLVEVLLIAEITGASFTGSTVNTKLSAPVSVPSVTVTVIVEVP